jgi:demethoxyubiquinone hydroxylase (CLK1/Coq7/Cat5 family)
MIEGAFGPLSTQALGYPLLTAAIRAGCRVAIGLSKRI